MTKEAIQEAAEKYANSVSHKSDKEIIEITLWRLWNMSNKDFTAGATLYAKELEEARKEIEKVEKMAEALSNIVYKYIQWVTSNTEKQPNLIKCHEAMDTLNDYFKNKPPKS